MKSVRNCYSLALFLLFSIVSVSAQNNEAALKQRVIAQAFEQRVKAYVSMREAIEVEMPKLSKTATPEQIEAHKKELLRRVQAARRGRAKRGDIFTPESANLIRSIIKSEFKGQDRLEFRKAVFEAENKGVPVRVNLAYPEAVELLEMPPNLLLTLPQLPKQIRYRFVGQNLLLMDRENHLIIDYMTNALP
jgi:hypothetical protein